MNLWQPREASAPLLVDPRANAQRIAGQPQTALGRAGRAGVASVSSPSFCHRSGVLMSAVRYLARLLPWDGRIRGRGTVRIPCAPLAGAMRTKQGRGEDAQELPSRLFAMTYLRHTYVIETTGLRYSALRLLGREPCSRYGNIAMDRSGGRTKAKEMRR
jgi:hypothetical protein